MGIDFNLDFVMWITGDDKETLLQLYNDWRKSPHTLHSQGVMNKLTDEEISEWYYGQDDHVKDSLILLREFQSELIKRNPEKSFVPYQACPNCRDGKEYHGSTMVTTCSVCNGKKIIPMFQRNPEKLCEWKINGTAMVNCCEESYFTGEMIAKFCPDCGGRIIYTHN